MLADFEQTMRLAAEESDRRDHRYLGTEHALLGLLRTSNARAVGILRSRGLTVEAVEAELGRLEAEGVVPRDGWPRRFAQPRDRHRRGSRSTGSFVRSRRGRRGDLPRDTSALVAPRSARLGAVGEARAREARARARRTTRGDGRSEAGDHRRRPRRDPARCAGSARDAAQPPRQALAPATRSCSGRPGTRASDRRSTRAQARAARQRADGPRPIRRQLIRQDFPFRARESCTGLLATIRTTGAKSRPGGPFSYSAGAAGMLGGLRPRFERFARPAVGVLCVCETATRGPTGAAAR